MSKMIPLGPEALMVKSSMDARVELAEFLRLEYAGADLRSMDARMRREAEAARGDVPSRRPLLSRARRWFRDDKDRAVASNASDVPSLSGATLAAMPAARAGACPEGPAAPLSVLPASARS